MWKNKNSVVKFQLGSLNLLAVTLLRNFKAMYVGDKPIYIKNTSIKSSCTLAE